MLDVTTFDGFLQAILMVLRLRPRALLHVGLPCSNYIWISRSVHGRSQADPYGNLAKRSVQTANTILGRVVLLICLATVRRVWWTLEQPKSSVVPFVTSMRRLLAMGGEAIQSFHIEFYMGAFGHWLPKASMCLGTAPWLPVIQYKGSRPDGSLFFRFPFL